MVTKAGFIGMIEEPSPFDTLQAWEQHLAKIERMEIDPQNIPTKRQLLRSAREMIAIKKAADFDCSLRWVS